MSVQGSFFYAMLSSEHWQPDEDGEYFIDRNPKNFDRILDYLRTGKWEIRGLSEVELDKIYEDMDFYQIEVPKLLWSRYFCGSHIKIEGNIARKVSGGDDWNSGILGDVANKSRYKFKLIEKKTGGITVGISNRENFDCNGGNYRSGWFYNLYNGNKHSALESGPFSTAVKISQGSVIQVIYDKHLQTISFEIDGQSLGVAFGGVCLSKWYPAVDINDEGAAIELLQSE